LRHSAGHTIGGDKEEAGKEPDVGEPDAEGVDEVGADLEECFDVGFWWRCAACCSFLTGKGDDGGGDDTEGEHDETLEKVSFHSGLHVV